MSHEDGRDDKTRELIHFGWRGWQRKAEKLVHSATGEGQIFSPPTLGAKPVLDVLLDVKIEVSNTLSCLKVLTVW